MISDEFIESIIMTENESNNGMVYRRFDGIEAVVQIERMHAQNGGDDE